MTIDQVRTSPARRVWIASFIAVSLVLLAVGYGYYRVERARVFQEFSETLTAVNKMKSAQIEEWRSERLIDIKRVVDGPMLKQAAANFIGNPGSQTDRERLMERLQLERMGHLYTSVALFTTDGRLILSTEDSPIPENSALLRDTESALSREQAVLTNLFSAANGAIYLDNAAALRN
jgi:hypothetical protein